MSASTGPQTRSKMNPTTSTGTTSGTDTQQTIMIPTAVEPIKKAEPTLGELMQFMAKNAEENRRHAEKMDKKMDMNIEEIRRMLTGNLTVLDQQNEKTVVRVSTVEEIVGNLQSSITPLVDKMTVIEHKIQKIKMTNTTSNVMSASSFHPPENSTTFTINPSFLSSSIIHQEKLKDVVSEFNGNNQSLHPQKLFLGEKRYDPLYSLVETPRDRIEDPNIRYILAREVQKTKAEKRRIRHNKMGIPVRLSLGEQGLVRTHNLSSAVDRQIHTFVVLYESPFTMCEIKQHNGYVVFDPGKNRIRGTYNVIFLRKYVTPTRNEITTEGIMENP